MMQVHLGVDSAARRPMFHDDMRANLRKSSNAVALCDSSSSSQLSSYNDEHHHQRRRAQSAAAAAACAQRPDMVRQHL